MSGSLSVRRQAIDDLMVFRRSDGKIFYLMEHDIGQAMLFNHDDAPLNGIGLDVSVADKVAAAEKLILAYPTVGRFHLQAD